MTDLDMSIDHFFRESVSVLTLIGFLNRKGISSSLIRIMQLANVKNIKKIEILKNVLRYWNIVKAHQKSQIFQKFEIFISKCLENVAENHEISWVGTKIQNHVWPESIFNSEIVTNGPLKEINHFIKNFLHNTVFFLFSTD